MLVIFFCPACAAFGPKQYTLFQFNCTAFIKLTAGSLCTNISFIEEKVFSFIIDSCFATRMYTTSYCSELLAPVTTHILFLKFKVYVFAPEFAPF